MIVNSNLTPETRSAFGNKTRGNILGASLELFNQSGFDAVSTAQIASASDVLDGTLWYHFKAKQDLATAHLQALETRLEQTLLASENTDSELVVERFLKPFDALWDFRYLLRDPLPALHTDSEFSKRITHAYESVENNTLHRLNKAFDEGLLSLAGVDASALAKNCVVIGRYWLEYARIRNGDLENGDTDKVQAARQVFLILRPYLTQKALSLIEANSPTQHI